MMCPAICRFVAIAMLVTTGLAAYPQSDPTNTSSKIGQDTKPYKVISSGKQITLKSTKEIQAVMAWTASGNRIHEQRSVNASSYTFTINNSITEKIFFLMVQLRNGKLYTEKIVIR